MQSSKESNIIIDIVENNTIYFEMHGYFNRKKINLSILQYMI